MRKRSLRLLLTQTLTMIGLILAFWNGPGAAAEDKIGAGNDTPVLLKAIKVSPDAYQVEIIADKPLTFTFYKTSTPHRAVIDLAQTDAAGIIQHQEVNSGAIKRINVTRHTFAGGFLSRVEIVLSSDDEFTVTADPSDKSRLVAMFAKPEPLSTNVENQLPAASVAPKETQASLQTTDSSLKMSESTQGKDIAGETGKGIESKLEADAAPATTKPPKTTEGTPTLPLTDLLTETEKKPEMKQDISASTKVEPDRGADMAVPQKTTADALKESDKKSESDVEQSKTTSQMTAVAADLPTGQPLPQPSEPTKPEVTKTSSLNEITAVEIQKDGIEIKVSGSVDSFNTFRLNKPERLIVDLNGIGSRLREHTVDVSAFGISKLRIGLNPDKVRLVFDSSREQIAPYQVVKSDDGLKIIFFQKGSVQDDGDSTKRDISVSQTGQRSKAKTAASIEAIDFEVKGDNSLVTITVSGACTPGRPVKVDKGLTLSFRNCQLPKRLQRAIDTSSFPSVVQSITPYPVKAKSGYDARLLVQLRGKAPATVRQSGDQYLLEIRNTEIPPPRAEKRSQDNDERDRSQAGRSEAVQDELTAEAGVDMKPSERTAHSASKASSKKVYTGRRVSLEFSDADVRKIFQLIAEVSNLNFLIADDVTGTISIKLVNVPWDQALEVILDSKGLEMKRDGNIVQIKPRGKFKSLEQEEAEAKKARERSLPLNTEIFEVNFASVADVETQFKSLKSERGSITRDERTNRVIVKDVQSAIEEMKFILKNIDLPEKQVLIEARIVEATTTFTRDLGVQWGLHFRDGTASLANVNSLDTGWGGVIGLPVPASGFNAANSPGASMGVSFGKLNSNIQLDLRLSAAASAGMVKIISSPKVVTLNNKQAKISQGQAIYLPTTSAEGTKQDKIEATLSLEVKPHITPDGSIVMTITAKNDAPGSAPAGASAAVNKKEANTELLVKNGETTVIGGIYVDSETEGNSGVPFLMDIPLLGWMFKSNTKNKTKTELLIFITPRIIL